jgi:chromosome segregation ATPase
MRKHRPVETLAAVAGLKSRRLTRRERDDAQRIDEMRAQLAEVRKKAERHRRALAALNAEEDQLHAEFTDMLKAASERRNSR